MQHHIDSMATTTWQTALFKLCSLIIILPFTISYLHLYYYTYWQNEYCLVGPHGVSMVSGRLKVDDATMPISTDTTTKFYGLYAPQSQKKRRNDNNGNIEDRRPFRQKYASSPSNNNSNSWSIVSSSGWPSITQSTTLISAPSTQLSRRKYNGKHAGNEEFEIVFVETKEFTKWCLQSSNKSFSSKTKWCSPSLSGYSDDTSFLYPPSGAWEHSESSTTSSPPFISISCPSPATARQSSSKTNYSKHKQQNAKQNQNLQFILRNPTTTLLLLLNTLLYFHYWNHRIPPSSVCKNYNKMCIHHEWWRGFTGATAHFEPLHIGFNMMSLNTLGRELEGGGIFGSVVFLVYNVAFVVMTSLVMMGMVFGRLQWIEYQILRTRDEVLRQQLEERQTRLRETSTVGYSAVLFAWMVISTLERNQPTCPIPFFSDVCFSTYSVPGLPFLKFNIAPVISLFIAQFIMPRVSFMGHLAGIICGFGLHWGWGMPPLEVCSPNVFVGGVFLVGCLGLSRRIVPVMPLSREGVVAGNNDDWRSLLVMEGVRDDVASDDQEEGIDTKETTTDPFVRSKQKKMERELEEVRRKQRTLISICSLIGIVMLASVVAFDVTSSLFLSQVLLLAYFICGTQSSLIVWTYTHFTKEGNDVINPEKERSGIVWRGFFVSAVLAIAVDSFSMASWFILYTLLSSARSPLRLGLLPVCIFMMARIAVNVLGLVVSSKILHDIGQVGGGIFLHVFKWVISWSKLIGDEIFLSWKPLWTAFEGRGIQLGARNRTSL